MMNPALVVMARAPEAGRVKTRMQSMLSPEQCADLYEAFLRDAIDLVVFMEGFTPFLAFTPPGSKTLFEKLIPPVMGLIPQAGGDLGEVMDGLINDLLSRRFSPVVLIGSDIPTLQPGTIRSALSSLERSDICLGPSRDGGYYLIGANKPIGTLFPGVPWSTPRVLKVTLEKAEAASLTVALIEELGDVDTIEDLNTLEIEIRKLPSQSGVRVPVHTATWLQNAGGAKRS